MKEILELAIKKLEDGYSQLKEGTQSVKDELDRDGVLKRFEFTYELLWKALKIYLEYNGIEVKTPRDSIKEAFKINIIEDEEVLLDMILDRNRISHIYDKNIAEEIYERIKESYIKVLEKVIKKLEEEIKKGG